MSNVDETPRLIQVTSSVAGEGKTTVSVALAQSAATSFKRVLLVDCDLRRPALSATFGAEEAPRVLSTFWWARHLSNKPLSGIRQRDCFFWAPGRLRKIRQTCFHPLACARCWRQLRETYDYIVLDSPPLGPVIDAVVLSQLVDKVVYVVHWNQTPRDLVARGLKQFQPENKIAGVILNCVDTKQSALYGGYYYSKYNEKYYAG